MYKATENAKVFRIVFDAYIDENFQSIMFVSIYIYIYILPFLPNY